GELVFCHANLMRHEKPDGRFISFFYDVTEALKECKYDAVIYLKAPPETCFKRIKYRARDAETGIGFEYISYLNDCYDVHLVEAARAFGIPLVTVDWANFGNPEEVAEQLLTALDYHARGDLLAAGGK